MIAVGLAAVWAAIVLVAGGARRSTHRWTGLVACEPSTPPGPAPTRQRRWARGLPVLVVAIIVWVVAGPAGTAVVVGVGALVRRTRQVRQLRRAHAARVARLPDAIDLLVLAGSAGVTARRGLVVVTERGPPVLRPAFRDVTAQLDAGAPLADALPRLVESVGEPARAMVRAVLTAERDGVPIGSLLTHLADDARRQRRHELEAAIRRLPIRLTFPLACCSLPAFVLLTVVPLVAAGLRRLGPVAI
jgi:hypothetical protein